MSETNVAVVQQQDPQVIGDQDDSVVENRSEDGALVYPIGQFLQNFQDSLLESIRKGNRPLYQGPDQAIDAHMDKLLRKPFTAQREVIQAQVHLLEKNNAPAGIINAEMGTGKTFMAIGIAHCLYSLKPRRTLVIAPPHLVYKWRREIKNTVPNARVWILNGADTLRKLISFRAMLDTPKVPEFFILGRVRMRMGFNWKPAFTTRLLSQEDEDGNTTSRRVACCPHCGEPVRDPEIKLPVSGTMAQEILGHHRQTCKCGSSLWTLVHQRSTGTDLRSRVSRALLQLPTIGEKRANKLLDFYGEQMLSDMLVDNIYEFVNLMDENGDLVFNDRQAARIERALATTEIDFGQGGYQATEFIKRYLPQGYFGLLVVDEGHEYKNEGSAQGQAFGVLARKCKKALLLTGTLMGGYADDLFYLLWRLNPERMSKDGYACHRIANSRSSSLNSAANAFLRNHGILREVLKASIGSEHKTSRSSQRITRSVTKRPGFSPQGVMHYLLPVTSFLKLKNIDGNVLPPYDESYINCQMTERQANEYSSLQNTLTAELKAALTRGDHSLLGVVLNCLLAWPDCCFREEIVKHPKTRSLLAQVAPVFDEALDEIMPKEKQLLEICKQEIKKHRRVLVYSVYSGTRDVQSRLQEMLEREGCNVAVLRATVPSEKREDWVLDQVEKGINVMICNPELVKTGLDLLEFPTIVFMQTGFNVYTVQQAARRSWRIGQKLPVKVLYLGYQDSAQSDCLRLMGEKIAVSQSTSGDVPESGLEVLNPEGDSIEVALAKKLVTTAQ